MAGSISSRAARTALNLLAGTRQDMTVPQSMQLLLLTAPPDINAGVNRVTEVADAGYTRQTVAFAPAVAGINTDPASIKSAADVLFGPFTANQGLLYPTTHCALVGTGAPVSVANLIDLPSSEMSSAAGWVSVEGSNTVATSNEQAQVGTLSLKVTAAAAGNSAVQTVAFSAVEQNTSYLAESWVYSPVAGVKAQVDVSWYTNDGVFLSASAGTQVTLAASTWTKVNRAVTLRRTDAYKAKVTVKVVTTGANQSWYTDVAAMRATATEDILMAWQFDAPGLAAHNESLQISAGDLVMSFG